VNNSLGTDYHEIVLLEPGKPEPPSDVDLLSTTDHSVTLSWIPGFDGGYNQTFVVTLLDQKTMRMIRTRTLDPSQTNGTTLEGLSQHTSYLIRVQAKNKAGLSGLGDEVFVKTRGNCFLVLNICYPETDNILYFTALENSSTEAEVLPRVMIVGIVLVVVMVALVFLLLVGCCCCKNNRNKRHHTDACTDNRNNQRRSVRSEGEGGAAGPNVNRNKKGEGNGLNGDDHHIYKSNNLVVERYPSSAYTTGSKYAVGPELFYPTSYERTDSSSSSTAPKVDYKSLARSLSMPNADDEVLGGISGIGGGGGGGFLPNGGPPGRHNSGRMPYSSRGDSSCSLHLMKNRHSSIGANTTLDDDVFEDSSADASCTDGGFRSRHASTSMMPSSAKRLLSSNSRNNASAATMFPRIVNIGK
jgi:hypothetical protein